LKKLFDVRRGELRVCGQAFLVLLLMVAAHTILETARDTLFLLHNPSSGLSLMYVALACLTFFANAGAIMVARRVGHRRALLWLLVAAIGASLALSFVVRSNRGVCAVYLFSGLVGVLLSPHFWLLAANLFTQAQGRRLFSLVAAGGIVGGVFGAGIAGYVLRSCSATALLPLAAGSFALASLALATIRDDRDPLSSSLSDSVYEQRGTRTGRGRCGRYAARVVALVVTSAAAVLIVDYLFKVTIASRVPAASLGGFFARFYAAMNLVSFGVQIILARPALRRLGVVGAACVMPFLLIGGGIAAFCGGGTLLVVLGLKAIDGGLRYSLNRVAIELLYLPVPETVRDRTKGLFECVVGRVVQACTGGVLYLLALRTLASPRILALLVVVLSLAWAWLALSLRRPYADLIERRRRLDATTIAVAPR
jgi:AAA family ATP:ADP antiporter